MSISLNFEDRFSYPDPNGPAPGISKDVAVELSSEELLGLSSELSEMVRMVRSYSILLQQVSPYLIFTIITTDSDPQIALILSAAKSKLDNSPLFGGLGAVKELMFGSSNRPNQTKFVNRDLFSDGIRRVSAALTAARLIGQFAQISQQQEHSDKVREDAIRDLERIVATWELANDDDSDAKKDEESIPSAFYFEPKIFDIPGDKKLVVEWQSPSITNSWALVGEYITNTESWIIVNDIVNSINSGGLYNTDNILLAAAELSGPYVVNPVNPNPTQYHCIKFYPRKPIPGVWAYSINIRINVTSIDDTTPTSIELPINRSPFIWGTEPESLNTYIVNGSLIVIRNSRLQYIREMAEDYDPFVLYFKNNEQFVGTPEDISKLVYRVQPWQRVGQDFRPDGEKIETIEIEIPRLTSDDPDEQIRLDRERFSQVSLALANSLADIELDCYISTAIIRNDPITAPSPMSALELVAWSRQRFIAASILDILELPKDIDIATGDRGRPLTLFSNKPRTIMVKNPISEKNSNILLGKEKTFVSGRRRTNFLTAIRDEAKTVLSPTTYY
jgi:hypothetical protein